MNNHDHMQDWNGYRDVLMARVGEFAKLSPDSMKGLMMVEQGVTKSGLLDPKVMELIALAVAVTTRCDGCISVHAQKAISLGLTREEIAQAMAFTIFMNSGAALTYTARVFDVIDALPEN